tara:strand:- start:342 stop:482 length:141 start_codon:yes stop_codon:yes gene_type:complete
MSKRSTGLSSARKSSAKKSTRRLATKKRMLELKAMKPAERKKALAG